MALNKNIPELGGRQITWTAGRNHGTLFASDIRVNLNTRIYDDACDVGFYVKSHRTGVRVLFTALNQEVYDTEMQMYEGFAPGGRRLTIMVFNT